jgi:small subunit ribosomal protein S17
MDKTRRVEIRRLVRHPKYGKYVRQRTICYAHDEANVAVVGDKVEIVESAPKSKLKRWTLTRVIEKITAGDAAALKADAGSAQPTDSPSAAE